MSEPVDSSISVVQQATENSLDIVAVWQGVAISIGGVEAGSVSGQ
jgi:hypothetical protein